MRTILAEDITNAVAKLCISSNINLGNDIITALNKAKETENNELAKDILQKTIENAEIAQKENIPICQDTGMAIVFLEVGQDVHIVGNLKNAVNEGVKKGYSEGYLRKSVVKDPIERINTNDNTPAIIHFDIVDGDKIKIIVAPKGFGSENMSRIKMLSPSDGLKGVCEFIIETVKIAGSNPCPPVVVGVGIGGSFEKAAILSKKALLRNINTRNSNSFYENLENELLTEINKLSIGPQGFGGNTTALSVNIESYPTHIASLPVAVNISCYVTRHKEIIL